MNATTPSAQTTTYAYDAVGNRTSVTGPGGNTTYTYDSADQLLTANTATFAYDKNGSQPLDYFRRRWESAMKAGPQPGILGRRADESVRKTEATLVLDRRQFARWYGRRFASS